MNRCQFCEAEGAYVPDLGVMCAECAESFCRESEEGGPSDGQTGRPKANQHRQPHSGESLMGSQGRENHEQ